MCAHSNPSNKWRRVENCSYAIALCKEQMELPLINIGAFDIVNGSRKLILALFWQLMRMHLLEVLSSLRLDVRGVPRQAAAVSCCVASYCLVMLQRRVALRRTA